MRVIKNYGYCVMIIAIYTILSDFYEILNKSKSELPIYQSFLQSIFQGSYNLDKVNIPVSIVGIGYIIIFNIIFGSYLYSELHCVPEYIFTRYNYRWEWYLKKILYLLGLTMFYNFLYVFFKVLIISKNSKTALTKIDLTIIASVFLIMSLFTLVTTLFVNIVSIFIGSNSALVILYVIEGFSTTISYVQSKQGFITIIDFINPMSNVLIPWNYDYIKSYYPIIYFGTLNLILVFIGILKIKRMDLGLVNKDDK